MKKIKLSSYQNFWNIEHKLYGFNDIKFPFPIVPRELLYTLIAVILVIFLSYIPLIGKIPILIRFTALPWLIVNLLMKKKLDGKTPIRFFFSYILYISRIRKQKEIFKKDKEIKAIPHKIKLKWNCTARL